MFSGRCECGEIRYEVSGEVHDYSHCHCGQCRRMHGAAFASFAGVRRDAFKMVQGNDALARYESSPNAERTFCRTCGSNIYFATTYEPDVLYISLGTADGDPPLPRGYHIFVGSKAPWYAIDDDLPQYEEEP